MVDSSVKKVESEHSPTGALGQKYLVAGKAVSLRLWSSEMPGEPMIETIRDYETVGYVISGRAELRLEGQTIRLDEGDSWLVPKGATHSYKIIEAFTAIEATSPPAEFHNRDAPPAAEPIYGES